MKRNQILKSALFLSLTAIALNGCGGSGGGSDDDVGGITYEGKTTPANVSSKNATDLSADATGVYALVGDDNFALRSAETGASGGSGYVRYGFETIARIKKSRLPGLASTAAHSRLASRENIDESENCDSGTQRIVGYVEESDGSADLSIIFDNCRIDGDLLDGEIGFQIDALDLDNFFPLEFKLTFEKLRVKGDGVDISIGGSLSYRADDANNQQRETITDLVIRDNDSGDMLRIVDLVSVYTFDDLVFPSTVTVDIKSGRVYDSRYGYVKVTSPVVISFSSVSQEFPDAGQYRLSANGRIRVIALDATTVQIDADTDDDLGNGYEFTTTVSWEDLHD